MQLQPQFMDNGFVLFDQHSVLQARQKDSHEGNKTSYTGQVFYVSKLNKKYLLVCLE